MATPGHGHAAAGSFWWTPASASGSASGSTCTGRDWSVEGNNSGDNARNHGGHDDEQSLAPAYLSYGFGWDQASSTTSSTGHRVQAARRRRRRRSRPQQRRMKTFLELDTSSSIRSLTTSRSHPSLSLSRPMLQSASSQADSQTGHDSFDANVFLFSGRTSTATMTTAADAVDAANVTAASITMSTDDTTGTVEPTATTLHHSALRELRESELLQDHETDLFDRGRHRQPASSHHLRVLDPFSADQRPSSSRSHLRYWHRSKSPVPDAPKYHRVSSDGSSPSVTNLPSMTMTREEFEALPPTIQRKYFSTLERIHFSQNPSSSHQPVLKADACQSLPPLEPSDDTSCQRPSVLTTSNGITDSAIGTLHRRDVDFAERQFYASLPDKIKRLHLSREEQLAAQSRRRSLSVDATDLFTRRQQRQSARSITLTKLSLASTVSLFDDLPMMSTMQSSRFGPSSAPLAAGNDTFIDSFRWLEEEDDLDLRLFLDDYHINLREEVPPPSKSRRPSFRRHLSISKLPFGKTNMSTTGLSTSSKGYVTTPTAADSPSLNNGGTGHVRRKSRTLSLLNGSRQQTPVPATVIDPAAAHYQDPEARLRLKEYLGSPKKFDEALEFGFPSMEERPAKNKASRLDLSLDLDKPRTFLDDEDNEDKSSTYSDDASLADPESPRTPLPFDRPPVEHTATPAATETHMPSLKPDLLQAPLTTREMTLRMTLTRPDLRANDEQVYGWQKGSAGRVGHFRAVSKTPTIRTRDISPKESIERQFAAFDQEDMATHDSGVVKRFWKRVRGT